MTPWWTDGQAGLFGAVAGGGLGVLGGVLGIVCGICAPRGKCKTFVYGLAAFMIGVGIVSLVAGVIALALRQPYGVWYPLLLMGLICTGVVGGLIPVIRRVYRMADQRRLEAEELRRS